MLLAELLDATASEGEPPGDGVARSWEIAVRRRPADAAWALGESWRALYPALVVRGSHGGIPDDEWPRFALLAREMERIAFGPPPINAAKLLALIEAGIVVLERAPHADADVSLDAVLPPPGAAEPQGDLVDQLLERGLIRRAAGGRRGIEVGGAAECVGADGEPARGLAAVGRLTEDWVIGNDTLNRGLHPHPASLGAGRGRLVSAGAPSPALCVGAAPLTARLEAWQRDLLDRPKLLEAMLSEHGSPLNLIAPEPMAANLAELESVAAGLGLDFRAYFARKANKSLALVDRALELGAGVDVAGLHELAQALGRGAGGDDIVLTAAIKSRALIELCRRTSGRGCVIDNADELALAREVAADGKREAADRLPARAQRRRARAPAESLRPAGGPDPRARRRTRSARGRRASPSRRHPLPRRRLRPGRPGARAACGDRARRRARRARAFLALDRHRRRHPDALPP